MKSSKDYSNKYAVYIAAGRIASLICGFILPIYLTRFLSKHDYGLYSQFFTLEYFLGGVLSLGIPTCIYYFYPKMIGQRKSLLFNNLLTLSFVAFVGVVLLNIPYIGEKIFNNNELFEYVHIISVFLLFFLPNKQLEPLFVVRKNKWISVIVPPIETLSRLFCVIISSQIWGTLEAIFFSLAVFQMILWIFMLIYAFGAEKSTEKIVVSRQMIKEQLEYSLPFGFAVILNSICLYFDRIICMGTLNAEEYAIYGIAFFAIPGMRQIYDSVSLVNLTNMTKAYHEGHTQDIVLLYSDFVRQIWSFSLPIIIGVCLFADDIIRILYTDKYIESTPFFRIYVGTLVITYMGAGTILRATGKTKYSFRANLFAAIIYVPSAFLLIKSFGIWGAIFASVLGNVLPRLFKMMFEIRLMNSSLIEYLPWRKMMLMLSISLIFIIPIFTLKTFYHPSFIWCVIMGFIYVFIVFLVEIKLDLFVLDRDNFLKLTRKHFRYKFFHRE